MHTTIVITRSRSREVAQQVAAINARIRACYPIKGSGLTIHKKNEYIAASDVCILQSPG